jgi:deoxyadenosine/deoxycytidine kinase
MTKIVSIEGNIGVGKTTFINLLIEHFKNSCIVSEPVDMWLNIKNEKGVNILDIFYKDTKRWAYTFQNIAYLTRIMKIQDKIKEDNYDYIFLDRSLYTDKNVFEKMLHDDGMIDEVEHSAYNMWYDFYTKYVNNLTDFQFIYLKADPEVCASRIKIRNRKEEENISLEYLKKINRYHDDWLESDKKNVLTIDCNSDFEHNELFQQNIISSIKKFI